MAEALEAEGVPSASILRERCSFSTQENARYTAGLLARRGASSALVVTCAWHLPRAMRAFERAFERDGMHAEGLAVPAPVGGMRRTWYGVRERIAWWLDH
jgi:uncharacterized SAM-binding protein YcdF (DUF218 family)